MPKAAKDYGGANDGSGDITTNNNNNNNNNNEGRIAGICRIAGLTG